MMSQRASLKDCAKKLKLNIATAFYWRHKILKALVNGREDTILSNIVYMRKLRMKENFKGQRHIKKANRDKIWVVLASDTSKK